MAARRRHLQRSLHVLLPLDVFHVSGVRRFLILSEGRVCLVRGNGGNASQVGDQGNEAVNGDDVQTLDQSCFGRVHLGHVDGGYPTRTGVAGHGQDAIHVAHRAVEAQFAHEQRRVHIEGNLSGSHQQADGDRQIVGRPLLAQIGGSQIDSGAVPRMGQV